MATFYIKDEIWFVRLAVTEQGRLQDLEVLKNDVDPRIALRARKKLEELKK